MELMERLKEARDFVEAQGYACAYLSIYGSQNYGLALDGADYRSDVDIKCAAIPTLRQLAAEERVPPAVLDWQGGQIEVKDVRRFTEVAGKLNPSYLEALMTPHYLAVSPQFETIRKLAAQLPGQDRAGFLQALKGVALQKKKNLCHPFPAAKEKIEAYGYDGKQAHHMYRLLVIMRAFERTGVYELAAPREEYDFLIALKKNEIPLEQALALTEAWAQEMAEICSRVNSAGHCAAEAARRMQHLACEAIEERIRNIAEQIAK